ncbi:MAG: hypothetical protein LBV45_07525 [Xanthomonadaceae bacterium]|nr:hypothetical protein [Xanthomonadaceae bacterium]
MSETTGEAAFPIAAIAGGDRIMQYDGEPSTPASALIKTRDGDESITAEDCPRAYGVLFGTSEDHCESKNERPTQADAISRYS